jgi:hypothetical protein
MFFEALAQSKSLAIVLLFDCGHQELFFGAALAAAPFSWPPGLLLPISLIKQSVLRWPCSKLSKAAGSTPPFAGVFSGTGTFRQPPVQKSAPKCSTISAHVSINGTIVGSHVSEMAPQAVSQLSPSSPERQKSERRVKVEG